MAANIFTYCSNVQCVEISEDKIFIMSSNVRNCIETAEVHIEFQYEEANATSALKLFKRGQKMYYHL